MATWTTEERDQLKAAVLALATGARVVTVNYSGPPARSVTYGAASLDDLRKLLAEAEAAVGSSSNQRTTVRYPLMSKGFR